MIEERPNLIQNTMSGTNHKFVLHKTGHRIFNWNVQNFTLPDISITTAKATSSPKVASFELAGTALVFERLTVRFLMDENIEAWQEIYVWLKELVDAYKHQPTSLYGQAESTAAIHITTNNHSSMGKVFTFRRLFPVRLGGIEFDSTSSDPNVLSCDVTFAYDVYDLEIDAGVTV
ncbi:T4-like virus tail tube protein gp19 [compost metagenome]